MDLVVPPSPRLRREPAVTGAPGVIGTGRRSPAGGEEDGDV
jgi:NADH-quinone oxidoreductase subunit H